MLLHALLGLSPLALVGLAAALILGGSIKGALGLGLPVVAVPLAAQFLDLPAVIGLLTVPLIATNLTQAVETGGTLPALQRLWPTLIAVVLGTWAGVRLLVSTERGMLYAVVGSVLLLLALWLLCRPRVTLSPSAERWAGPPIGLAAGMVGGISGMFGPPLIAYLVGLGLEPDVFVKYISLLFLAATVTLLLALGHAGALSPVDVAVSAAAMAPIQLGVIAGRWLRRRCPAWLFRAVVLLVLAFGGLDMLHRALF